MKSNPIRIIILISCVTSQYTYSECRICFYYIIIYQYTIYKILTYLTVSLRTILLYCKLLLYVISKNLESTNNKKKVTKTEGIRYPCRKIFRSTDYRSFLYALYTHTM